MVLTKLLTWALLATATSAYATPSVRILSARYYGVDSKPAAQDQCTAQPHAIGCWVVPSQTWPDPAPGFAKYFQVSYSCDGGDMRNARVDVVVENRPMLLDCPQTEDPTRIHVRAASYGGVVTTPLSALQCSQTNSVSECRIKPSETLWYDPRPGQPKMYNVVFGCPGGVTRNKTVRQVETGAEIVIRCP